MRIKKFNLNKISEEFKESWSPIDAETIENFVLRVAKFEGKYHWHRHEHAEEMFIVFSGKIKVQTKEGDYVLVKGEGIKIPKGVDHCPVAFVPSIVLMFESMNLESKGR